MRYAWSYAHGRGCAGCTRLTAQINAAAKADGNAHDLYRMPAGFAPFPGGHGATRLELFRTGAA